MRGVQAVCMGVVSSGVETGKGGWFGLVLVGPSVSYGWSVSFLGGGFLWPAGSSGWTKFRDILVGYFKRKAIVIVASSFLLF